jgi:hypothetical protein
MQVLLDSEGIDAYDQASAVASIGCLIMPSAGNQQLTAASQLQEHASYRLHSVLPS